jgi:hypothetical protein
MSKNQCHSEPTHHDSGCDHQAALISADVHASVNVGCTSVFTTTDHAAILPCDGGLADTHHAHTLLGIPCDPDVHV